MRDAGRFTNIRCTSIVGGANFDKQVKQIRAGAQITVPLNVEVLKTVSSRFVAMKLPAVEPASTTGVRVTLPEKVRLAPALLPPPVLL